MKRAVIIVAAGSGSRMGGTLPKQYQELLGKPVIIHTLEAFHRFDPGMQLVLVLAPEHRLFWEKLAGKYELAGGLTFIPGGSSRFDSVKNGLTQIKKQGIVGIHDAVRPLVSSGTLARTYNAAEQGGSGIPVIEMDDSVRKVDPNGNSEQLNRSSLRRVQTPQVFLSQRIKEAYQKACDPSFTDDASVYEAVFGPVTLVEGNRENIKITTPADMKLASLLMGSVV
ncbi:MAG: 2-C-methyl-D-erythritol 4-phosphate cytidylyltransferase [Bacteroidales bacterium]|nr:2-C-methyl-D-erythritol 4-phosphate cytidylyltransferase [Bacteroidales bacterium]